MIFLTDNSLPEGRYLTVPGEGALNTVDYGCPKYKSGDFKYCSATSENVLTIYMRLQSLLNQVADALGIFTVPRLDIDGRLGRYTRGLIVAIFNDSRAQAIAPEISQNLAASSSNPYEDLAIYAPVYIDALNRILAAYPAPVTDDGAPATPPMTTVSEGIVADDADKATGAPPVAVTMPVSGSKWPWLLLLLAAGGGYWYYRKS